MYIQTSRMQFCVGELCSVDNNYNLSQEKLQSEYDGLIYRHSTMEATVGLPSILIASLTSKQVEGNKFLLANGFKLVGDQKINPNTTNVVQTYVKIQEPKLHHPHISSLYSQWRASYSKDHPDWSKRIYLGGTGISCSTYCLVNAEKLTSKDDFALSLMNNYKPTCAIVLAAIPLNKAEAVKVLDECGFVKVEEFVSYYPDNEKYGLFIKYITREDRKTYRCETRFDLENKTE